MSSPATRSARSTLAAMTCSSSRLVPRRLAVRRAIRRKVLRRGRIERHDVVAIDRHPIADRREVRASERSEPERTGDDGRPVAGAIADDRGLAMDGDDAGRAKAGGRMRLEGLGPGGVPAERDESVGRGAAPSGRAQR